MNLTRAFFLCLVAVSLLFSSCKKEEPNVVIEDDLSIDGGWSITSIETNLDDQAAAIAGSVNLSDLGGIDPDVYEMFLKSKAQELEQLEDCQKDDAYLFYRSGELGFKNRGTICEFGGTEDSDSIFSGPTTWSLSNNTLTFTDSEGSITYSIFSLAEQHLFLHS